MALTKLGTDLLEHQTRVLDKLYSPEQRGIIAYHSMGSGKTLTALEALKRSGGNKLVITPASLVDNIKKESLKHKIPLDANTSVMSYELAAKHIDDLLAKKYGLVVFDEAHRLRNSDTERAKKLRDVIGNSDRVLMLSGTAGYNHPADIGRLINLINKDEHMPDSNTEFEDRYIDRSSWRIKNRDSLKRALQKYVDVYDTPRSSDEFPETSEEIIRIPMSDKQKDMYKFVSKDIPATLRNALKNNLPLSLQDTSSLNMFSTGVRQVSDSTMHHDIKSRPEDSTKLVAAANSLALAAKNPRFRGVAYSNYLDAGIDPYEKLLQARGISPLKFTGNLSAKQKKALVDEYNSDTEDPKVLLVSSSGTEGLDLKGTRLMQILEPHFNQSKIDQVIARGSRYKSHSHLPESERNMRIERYHATIPSSTIGKLFKLKPPTAIDDYLYKASVKKQRLIDEIKDLVTEE